MKIISKKDNETLLTIGSIIPLRTPLLSIPSMLEQNIKRIIEK